MKVNQTRRLEWDSSFFSLEIASIVLHHSDDMFLEQTIRNYIKKKTDLLYLFIDEGIILPDSILSNYHHHLVDKKRIYEYSRNMEVSQLNSNICEYQGDPSVLYDLAIQAGINSRFRIDPDFPNEKFEALYRAWIDKSVSKELADKVLIYKDADKIIGLLTLQKKNDFYSIGLVATDKEYRCKGIGKALMKAAKYYAYLENCSLSVVTQAENRPACQFYEKEKFVKKSDTTIYHIWLNK